METVASPTWLQYGALGLLGLVLVAVFFTFREYVKGNGERRTKSEEFFRGLVDKLDKQHEVHIDAWKEMVKMMMEESARSASIMETVVRQLNEHEERANERHKELMELSREKTG